MLADVFDDLLADVFNDMQRYNFQAKDQLVSLERPLRDTVRFTWPPQSEAQDVSEVDSSEAVVVYCTHH